MGTPAKSLILQMRKWFRASDAERCDDESLLKRFVAQRDEDAFAALVDRYGPLVLGVCREVLGDEHAAEDAFQATFMILARKAASVRRHRALAAWLHRVSSNVARTARTSAARRRHHEQRAAMDQAPNVAEVPDTSWQPILHAEIDRLPEKYRLAIVLCYLHGKTNEEAARELGWPVGTVKSSLARGREVLRERLDGRGLAVAAALLGADCVAAAVPPTLARATIQSAVAFAAGQAATSVVSESVVMMVEGGLANMGASKLKPAVAVCLTLAVLGAGAGVICLQALGDPPQALDSDQVASPKLAPPVPPVRPEPLRFKYSDHIAALAIAPDGKALAVGGHHNSVSVFDLATGKKLRDFSGDHGIVSSVAFSPDGKILAVGSQGSTVRLWDVPGGRELRKIEGKQAIIETVAFSPDSKLLATSGAKDNGVIYLWDVESGKEIDRLFGNDLGTDVVVFSPDRKFLAAVGIDKAKAGARGRSTVRVWDTAKGKLRHEWTGIQGGPNVLALSADGRILVQGGENAPVRFLDTTTGKQLRTIDDLSMVHSLALSPDGRLLVTASGYQKYVLQVWEVATATELRRVTDLSSDWSRVAFSSDGKLAWGSGGDITVLLDDGITLTQDRLPAATDRRPREIDTLWADLASTDGRRAYQALATLRTSPRSAMALLNKHLRPTTSPDPDKVARLLANLDSGEPAMRDRASVELERLGSAAIPFLKKLLTEKRSLEVRRRAEELLSRAEGKELSPQILRIVRAIHLLEVLDAPEAQPLLEELAQGSANRIITTDARDAAQRRSQRTSR